MFPSRLVSVLGKGAALENNYSLDFDGTNDYVDCGTAIGTALGDSYDGGLSVSMWVKADEVDEDVGLFTISDSFGSGLGEITIQESRSGDGFMSFTVSGVESTMDFATAFIGVWSHIVGVFDGANNMQYLYLDGVLKDSDSNTNTLDLDGLKTIIGAYYSSSYGVEGNIDEVAVYNKALSAGDVAALYEAKGTSDLNDDGNSANLKGWWRMGDGVLDDFGSASGLIADQTNPTLGSELVTNGTFDSDVSGWTAQTNVTATLDSNRMKITANASGGSARVYQSMSLSADSTYRILIDVDLDGESDIGNMTFGTGITSTAGAAGDKNTYFSTTSSGNVYYVTTDSTATYYLSFRTDGNSEVFFVDNISLRKINGNPGLMTNMTASDIAKDTP